MQTVIERDRSKIHSLNEKLHRTQQMLYDSTKDYLELKYEGRSQERVWMVEKDRLLQELDRCKEQLDVSKDDVLVISDHALEERQTQNLEIEDKTEKLAKRLHLMNQRYEAMEKRRNLEIEGFKNDTRILRNQLKDVEKQLYKVEYCLFMSVMLLVCICPLLFSTFLCWSAIVQFMQIVVRTLRTSTPKAGSCLAPYVAILLDYLHK
ncbi:coiled-coil domain-containing protein 77-like [Patiria miniata]|uniref:Uncharacterized protein n=1 Tax=Patiria miniata TaxID=46514 RepID=A0A913Z7E5_PATMI|nr:coiled-coil domain-containing protein 77-like [Patiria miniata]